MIGINFSFPKPKTNNQIKRKKPKLHPLPSAAHSKECGTWDAKICAHICQFVVQLMQPFHWCIVIRHTTTYSNDWLDKGNLLEPIICNVCIFNWSEINFLTSKRPTTLQQCLKHDLKKLQLLISIQMLIYC